MDISRRNFIKASLGVASFFLTPMEIMALAAQAANGQTRRAGSKVFVIVQLAGGNDGLNTVIPYGAGAYYQARRELGIEQAKVIALNGKLGLHPNMQPLADLYAQKKLAIVQGCGYANPSRSHFRSIEIWQTGDPAKIADTGWLGRYLDFAQLEGGKSSGILLPAVNVDPILPKTLSANKVTVPSVSSVYDFRFRVDPKYPEDRAQQLEAFNDIYSNFNLRRPYVDLLRKVGLDANAASDYLLKVVRNYKGNQQYPENTFGRGLKFIAQMITGGVSSQIYNISLQGFDTHANQTRTQAALLKQLADGLSAFQADMEAHGVGSDVIVMTFSEFGRRVSENGARGTDHGTAAPLFVMGSAVKGGIYGDHPSLTNLDDGDLKYKVDFRQVYATILDRWLQADSHQILGAKFDTLSFV